jgi:hypothetical protein
MLMVVFSVVPSCGLRGSTNVSTEHTASVFRADVPTALQPRRLTSIPHYDIFFVILLCSVLI